MVVKDRYENKVKKDLQESFSISNTFAVPKITKVVLNTGFGKLAADEKAREQVMANLNRISGQKPAIRAARKAIASFKIRAGQPIGAQVTLRGKKMYDFLDKFTSIVLPRVRDFRGVSEAAFDGRGNYTLGFRELNVFPEIEYTKGDQQSGVEITLVTTSENDKQAKALLEGVGIPFRKNAERNN
jgi:large subunit ribosomal protein L5